MSEARENAFMEKIVSLCKRRGFIFQSSEIYGGINGFWDYGPLGVELRKNIRECWWKDMVRSRDDVVGLESVDHHAPEGLGGVRARGRFQRSHGGLQGIQTTISRRPDFFLRRS